VRSLSALRAFEVGYLVFYQHLLMLELLDLLLDLFLLGTQFFDLWIHRMHLIWIDWYKVCGRPDLRAQKALIRPGFKSLFFDGSPSFGGRIPPAVPSWR
jgi:hypothetical protein